VHAAAEASGAALGEFTAIGMRAWIYARRGDLPAAEAELVAALALAQQTQLMMGITSAAFFLSDVLVERDGLSAIDDLVEHVQLGADFLSTASGAMLLEARGRLRLQRRDVRGGIDDLQTAGGTFATLGFGPTFSSWRSTLAVVLPADELPRARALAADELELARSTGLARPIGVALRAVGILSDRADGIELLRSSVEVLEDSPARLELARSLIELGSAMRRANRRAEARPFLVEGLELAHACGAQRLTRRARQDLRAAGSRRSRIATSGRDSLTASELRVITLAAAGATNGEIAHELYVSRKTVETHLSHAYTKLGLAGRGSRERLAQVLDEPLAQ
jgi:DNA-binding CsgD family transcriptional regulator